jgi:hypothetical protein
VAHPRRRLGIVGDVAAAIVVTGTLLLPDRLTLTDLGSFAAVPVELVLGAALIMLTPVPARRVVAGLLGLLLGVLAVLKIIDAGFYAALSRPFDLVLDWRLAGGAWQLLTASLGTKIAVLTVAATLLVVVGLLLVTVSSVLRLTRLLDRHPSAALPAVAALAACWLAFSATGWVVAAPYPAASHASTTKIIREIARVREGRIDQQRFLTEAAVDDFRDVPADRLLATLHGKQVLLVFVESYGRVALEDPTIAPAVDGALDAGNRALADHGLHARSGYLTSPTAGGGSWLAHATLLSGLWIDNQRRYLNLMASDRLTLTAAFRRCGWHTLGVMPGVTSAWPDSAFYHFDEIYDSQGLGYAGPPYGWSRVPDQFTLGQIDRLRASHLQTPSMTVVPLVTSHAPWTPVPPTVGWAEVRNGQVYQAPTGDAEPPEAILTRDPERVRSDYARSIAYSLGSVLSYATLRADTDFVMIIVGDHQPAPVVAGPNAGRDVPITMISGDPGVLERIDGWGWTEGARPSPDAPVWRMDTFRDRFLAAYSVS